MTQAVAEQSGSKTPSSVVGGGEMGAAIRSFDWSRTPLGAIEGWPLSLRTATNACLSSRFAILVWWGPEFTMIYNDAYREIIAAKHPAALGQSGKECWNEIWDIVGPMLDSVVSSGQPTWSDDLQLLLEPHGYLEECYFRFSYSPIWDESGKVGGVFTPVTETTDRVIGERRLQTLRDLAVRTGEPRGVEQACDAVAAALATNPYDIPFALLYLTESSTQQLRLAAYAGIEPDGPASPRFVSLSGPEPWPLSAIARTGKAQRVDDVTERYAGLPSRAWGLPPSTAVVLPVALPGQSASTALLVLAVSPRKRLDAAYETFLSLVAGQVAAALAEALAYEERAEALAELDGDGDLAGERELRSVGQRVQHDLLPHVTVDLARAQPADGRPLPRILLADDNSDMRAYIQRLLSDRYHVEAVADSVAALAAARTRPPDLVLTDIMMPGLDGLALLRELRADARTNTIPVIVLSARAGDELRVQGLEAYADDYLLKPFSARELLARVGTHLEMSHRHREAARREQDLRARMEAAQQHANDILEGITAGFVAVDGDWRLTYANAAAEQVLRRGRVDLIGKIFWKEFAAVLGTTAETHLRRAMSEQVTVSFENYYAPSGRLFEVKAYPDRNGGVSVYFNDATQRWLVEETLRQTDQRYREAMDLLPAGVYVCDASGLITEHNRWATELWGRELPTDAQERFSGALRLYRSDGSVLPHGSTPTAEVLRTGNPVYDRELTLERPDGSRITVVENVAPLRDRLWKISGAVNCFHDITDRKRAEATRSHLAAIVESSDDAIFSKTLDGTITSWNQGAERLFGYSAEEVIGQSVTLLIAADRSNEEPEILARLRRGERIDHYETVRLHKNGRPLNVLVTVSPVKDRDGIIIGASDITHDITERKRAEAALREADREKDHFLAVLSHELRNPLAPIRNAVQLLRRAPLQDPLLERARDMIERQATHMTRLIDDLLDISRIKHGKIVLRNQHVNVADVVRAVADDHNEVFESGGVALQVDVPADPVWVIGDPTRLAQAVGNVLLNAAKFSNPRGRVWLYVRTESGQAVIGVHDTGIGIDHDAVDRVFEAFNQPEAVRDRNRSGLGLGLALVKGIVELHGGIVQARSKGRGRGAEFVIRLPLDSAPARADTLAPSAGPHAPKPCRVLVIEDNVDTAESMKLLLSYDGYQVTVAHSGADGVRVAREFAAEIIVCDIGLPGDMDGYAVARAIRQDPITSSAYLIALTGYGQEEDQRRARAAGFDLHLTKPIDFPALQRVLASAAASPAAQRDHRR